MINHLLSIAFCIIGLCGVLFIVSGAGLILGLAMTIIGFMTSFSLAKK